MDFSSWSDMPEAIYVALALVVVALGVPLIRWMLRKAAAHGGHRAGDAGDYAHQVLAQAEAFRGDDPDERVPWDGERRLTGVEEGTTHGGL